MKTIEYRTVPSEVKNSWGRGSWQNEPDKKQWQDTATGLPCLAVRHPDMGFWCGYVGVTKSHPAYGLHYDGITQEDANHRSKRAKAMMKIGRGGADMGAAYEKAFEGYEEPKTVPGIGDLIRDAEVHGGLTFAGPCQKGHNEVESGICHLPEPGESDDVWWFGFDCGHAFDVIPAMDLKYLSGPQDTNAYRDLEYVEREAATLAAHLAQKQLPAPEAA